MRDEVLEVDGQVSWARRVGDEIQVQLRLPNAVIGPGVARMQLGTRNRQLRLPAEVTAVDGATLVAFSAPQTELGWATWHLAVQRDPGGPFVLVQARLVTASESPVALLPGPAPSTRMPPPIPRAHRSLAHRLAGRLPAPVRKVLIGARAWGREAVRRARP